MPIDERRARQDALYKIIQQSDIDGWADRFLGALTGPDAKPRRLEQGATIAPERNEAGWYSLSRIPRVVPNA